MEGVAGRAFGRAALARGAVAGVGHAAVQARAALHPGRGGRGAGPVAHAEHRPDYQGALPPLAGDVTLCLFFAGRLTRLTFWPACSLELTGSTTLSLCAFKTILLLKLLLVG